MPENDDKFTMDYRPTLYDVWREHHFNTKALADLAELPESVIVAMLRHKPVLLEQAQIVMLALCALLKGHYTLRTVRVPLLDAEVVPGHAD